MTNPQDIIWLAGLLEGEGSFFLERVHGNARYAVIEVTMTDEDVIQRAAGIMGVKPAFRHAPAKVKAGHKPTWRARLRGKKAEALMRELLPQMGSRRSAKIEELLERKLRESNPGPG